MRPVSAIRAALTIPLVSLIAFHLLAAGGLLAMWHSQQKYTPTGDEPHYLIIADSIARYHSFEVTRAYQSELQTHRMYPPGLVPSGQRPVPKQKHEIVGPNGSFSIHNIGIPLLVLLAFEIKGPMGVRLFLLLISCLIPVIAWTAAGLFVESVPRRWLVAFTAAFSAQFIYYAGQIYPDLPGGIVVGLVAVMVVRKRMLKDEVDSSSAMLVVLLALTPWLHIRFAAPAVVCIAGMFLLRPRRVRSRSALVACSCMVGGMLILVALYNKYAFDQFTGPYGREKLRLTGGAAMGLFGIHLDQFEGIFLEAPILLAAVLGMAALMRRDWRIGLFLLTLHASFIVPNAMNYPDWYGGGSPAGRFGVAASVVLLIPATCGLAMVGKRFPRALISICSLHILLQGYFWLRYGPMRFHLYSPGAISKPVPLADYGSLYAPFQNFLPAFYRLDLVLTHFPNYVAVALVLCLAMAGWRMAATIAPFAKPLEAI